MKNSIKRLVCLLMVVCLTIPIYTVAVTADETKLFGDVNQNGIISSKDALITLLYCVKSSSLTDSQKTLADINDDGIVDVDDAYLTLLCAVGLQTSFRIDAFKANGTIWIAGDSIAEGGASYVGWGQVIGNYLTEGTTVNNTALSGSTARYFAQKNNYERIMNEMEPGDILFIAFGHNDSKGGSDPYGDSSTPGSYKHYIKYYYIEPALQRGGMPILMTSAARCRDINKGPEAQYHWLYIKAAKELAKEYKELGIEIPFIDMFDMTFSEYKYIGQSTARSKFHTDEIHYKRPGAEFAANLILYSIYEKGWDFSKYIDMSKVSDPRTYPH